MVREPAGYGGVPDLCLEAATFDESLPYHDRHFEFDGRAHRHHWRRCNRHLCARSTDARCKRKLLRGV